MNRRERPLKKRIISAVSSLALVATGGYVLVAGFTMISSIMLALVLLNICGPVVLDGGGVFEVLTGVVEAFVEGIMIVVDAIASLFSF
jgi:hypothetical protein